MGQKSAAYNAQGAITAFYDSIDSPVPVCVETIDITDEEWLACLTTTGYSISDGELVAPSASFLLAQAQALQSSVIDNAYATASTLAISFKTAGGVQGSFDADSQSQTLLMQSTQGYGIAGATPAGFYWKAADNTLVPFTLADLQGLYGAMLAQGWTAFQKRSTLKAKISAATTIEAVRAISWS